MGHTTTRMVQDIYQRVRRAGKMDAILKQSRLDTPGSIPKGTILATHSDPKPVRQKRKTKAECSGLKTTSVSDHDCIPQNPEKNKTSELRADPGVRNAEVMGSIPIASTTHVRGPQHALRAPVFSDGHPPCPTPPSEGLRQ